MSIKIFKVTGFSLHPAVCDGDYVIIANFPIILKITEGDIIAFDHPVYGRMIKYVCRVNANGKTYQVTGGNGLSLDSHQIGAVSRDNIIGKVIFQIKNHN